MNKLLGRAMTDRLAEKGKMKIVIEVEPKHWWIEKRDNGCQVFVKYEGKDSAGKEFKHEVYHIASTINEAAHWLQEALEGRGVGDEK